jgi:hypothetical protein
VKTVELEAARRLIDFGITHAGAERGFAALQLEGAVAAHNLLATNGFAYVADEVGLGKTYVALGVMGLLRHFQPTARIAVIAPRENIQRKWLREHDNFVARNWRVFDNRVKGIDGNPAVPRLLCNSLHDLAQVLTRTTNVDLFLRLTSFSLPLGAAKGRKRARDKLREALPRLKRSDLPNTSFDAFIEAYGQALNVLLPEIDLLVIDEAHNLKHGLRKGGSQRNRLLSLITGRASIEHGPKWEDYGPKVKRILLLSATPFEYDYSDLWNQLDVLNFGERKVQRASGGTGLSLAGLKNRDVEAESQRHEIARRFLIRRISGLKIGGELHTRNMYRREWRQGGFAEHDKPMHIEDAKQRLIVGLVQKKVAETLSSERFNNRFQIGMLSSFESFVETATERRVALGDSDEDEEDGKPKVFDGDQDSSGLERKGADSLSLAAIARSYRKTFKRGLPHPKLDATVEALVDTFEHGDKALIFVRRLATMGELAARLNDAYDLWLERRMTAALPKLESRVGELFSDYREQRNKKHREKEKGESDQLEGDTLLPQDDKGGNETFFAWFFRGEGPPGLLSGAAFQKNRLISPSSRYSLLFEDDYVAWLLGRPEDPWQALLGELGETEEALTESLRLSGFARFKALTKQREGYPAYYVFEAYQGAVLELLAKQPNDLGEKAARVLEERFGFHAREQVTPPKGFPGPQGSIGITTVSTLLAQHSELRDRVWPDPSGSEFVERFREREQRRELLSAMSRLGASYIDLYLLAIERLGTFQLGQQASGDFVGDLARAFVELLNTQREEPGFHAFRELSEAALAFETLVSANFPDVRHEPLERLRTVYGRVLQQQGPVATTTGGKVQRLVRQFRMPGYPLILVSTDILQEGEDLHTFCRRVIHYGITWTPSAMEQRSGRVDRIGSLSERRLDGRSEALAPDEKIQVYYPHLRETVEVLQVEEVLRRLNAFVRMIHRPEGGKDFRESRVDAASAMVREQEDLSPFQGRLESAFPVPKEALAGTIGLKQIETVDRDVFEKHLATLWTNAIEVLQLTPDPSSKRGLRRSGSLHLFEGEPAARVPETTREQPFSVELKCARSGTSDSILLVKSHVGFLDLTESTNARSLEEWLRDLGYPRLTALWDAKHRAHELFIERDMIFHPGTTQPGELCELIRSTAAQADTLEADLIDELEEVYIPARGRGARAEETEKVLKRCLALKGKHGLPFTIERKGNMLRASLPGGREQRVRVRVRGGDCLFTSRVTGPDWLASHGPQRTRQILRVWQQNGTAELVGFGIDRKNRVFGLSRHPLESLDAEELRAYLIALVWQCDRLEWVLTGEDRY